MTQQLENMRERQEAKASKDLSSLLTDAVQSSSVQSDVAEIAGLEDPKSWPDASSREIMTVLQRASNKAFGRVRGEYRNYDVETQITPPAGRPPSVSVTAVYKRRPVGGVTHIIKSGETIRSIAKWHYGLVCYANTVWEANARTYGPSCRQVPAGFPLVLPAIDVPWWDRAPRVKALPGTKTKAVRIVYPTLDFSLDSTMARKVSFATDAFSIEVICRFRGDAYVQRKGTIEPAFAIKTYQTSAARVLADLIGGNYVFSAQEKRGVLSVQVKNRKARGLEVSGSLKLSTGGPKVRLSGSMADVTHKDHALRFMASIEAAFRIVPRKSGKPVTSFEAPLSFSVSPNASGIVGKPLLPSKGSSAPAAQRGSAAVLSRIGAVG